MGFFLPILIAWVVDEYVPRGFRLKANTGSRFPLLQLPLYKDQRLSAVKSEKQIKHGEVVVPVS